METQKHYHGEFNNNGYSIYCEETERLEGAVYQAGNCRYDSAQYLPLSVSADILTITEIEEFCNSTGSAMAADSNGLWCGSGQIDDNDT